MAVHDNTILTTQNVPSVITPVQPLLRLPSEIEVDEQHLQKLGLEP